jgi:hypothetical protein
LTWILVIGRIIAKDNRGVVVHDPTTVKILLCLAKRLQRCVAPIEHVPVLFNATT